MPSYRPYSGDKLIFDDPELGNGTIRVDSVDESWDSVSARITGNTAVTLRAFDHSNKLLAQASTGKANYIGSDTDVPPNQKITVKSQNIDHVEFSDSGNTYTIDNFIASKSGGRTFSSPFYSDEPHTITQVPTGEEVSQCTRETSHAPNCSQGLLPLDLDFSQRDKGSYVSSVHDGTAYVFEDKDPEPKNYETLDLAVG